MEEMIAQRYQIKRLIGQGGMADVFLARDIILDRNVAVKVLRGDNATDPVSLLRFQKEAMALASTSHPNIVEVYDEYALVYNYEEKKFERVFYTKNDETDSVELGERETVYIIDVNEQEKNTIETLRKLNGETFSMINENLNKAEENAQEVITLNSKIEEQNNQISTLTTEKTNIEGLYTQANTDINTLNENIENLNNQINDLTEYKNNNENKLKDEVIAQYASQLSEEVLDKFKAEKEKYSVTDLDKELAYELKQTNPSVFSKQDTGAYIPKDTITTGIEAILAKYKK